MLVSALAVAVGSLAAPLGVVEDCSTRSEGRFPAGTFASPDNLVVGPLAMVGAGGLTPEDTVRRFGGNKFPLLVANRHRVTVQVRGSGATLGYGPLPEGEVRVEDGHRVVRFIACRRRSGSRAGRRRVTFWSGFVLSSEPQCVRLRVWVDREESSRRAKIPLGRDC